MKKAVRFEVKTMGSETRIVLFDKKDNIIVGDSCWDGDFYCSDNNLTSLEGCPSSISGHFYCSNNNLTSLEGCPSSICGNFYCYNNNLTSLKGCPSYISGNFYCYNNNLTSLKGCPSSIGGDFNCYNNNLTSLEGSPSFIGGYFSCSYNNLTKFPKEIYSKHKDCHLSGNKFEIDPSDTELINLLTSKKWSFVLLEKNTLSQSL